MHFLTIWGTSKSRVLMQSNPCTAIKSAASSPFPLPQQLFSSPEQHINICISVPGCRGAFIVSTSINFPLTKIKAAPSFTFLFSQPCCSSRASLGSRSWLQLFWGEGADWSQPVLHPLLSEFCEFCEQPQDLHPGLRSLFLRQVITRSIAAFFDHQSPPDCTNHSFHTTSICYNATKHLPLFGFLPLFYFVSLFLFYFLVPCFSPFHSSVFHWLKPGHGVYNFSFTSRGHLFIGKLSAPVAVVPKNWKIINTRRLNQSFTSKGVSPLILPEALCFKSLIYSSETYCWNIPLIKHPKANGWDWNGAVKLYHTPGALWLTGILTECHRFTGHVTHLFCFVTQLLPGATSVCHTFIATCLASFQNRSGAESTAYGTATQIQIMKDFFPPYLTNIWGPETSPYFKSLHLINVLSRMSAGDFGPVNNNHVALAGK